VEPLVLAHVIRDVLDSFTPTASMRITYNNRLLLAGAELKPSAVVNKPRVDVGGTDLRVFYTLVSKDDIILCSHHAWHYLLNPLYTDNVTTTLGKFKLNPLFSNFFVPHPQKGTGGSRCPKPKQSITEGVLTLVSPTAGLFAMSLPFALS
jgi:hypothetical protein